MPTITKAHETHWPEYVLRNGCWRTERDGCSAVHHSSRCDEVTTRRCPRFFLSKIPSAYASSTKRACSFYTIVTLHILYTDKVVKSLGVQHYSCIYQVPFKDTG